MPEPGSETTPQPVEALTPEQQEALDLVIRASDQLAQFETRLNDAADKQALARLSEEIEAHIAKLLKAKEDLAQVAGLNTRQKRAVDSASRLTNESSDIGFHDLLRAITAEIGNPEQQLRANFDAAVQRLKNEPTLKETAEGQELFYEVIMYMADHWDQRPALGNEPTTTTTKKAKETKAPKEREPQYHTKPFLLRNINKVFAQHGVVTLATVLEFVAHPKKPELRGQHEPQLVKEARERISERGAFNEFMREAKNRTSDMRFRNAEDFANVCQQILTEKSPIYLDKISLGAVLLLAQELGVLDASHNVEKITGADDLDEAQALEAKLKKIIGANEQWKSGEPKHEALKNFLKLSQLEALFGNSTPDTTAQPAVTSTSQEVIPGPKPASPKTSTSSPMVVEGEAEKPSDDPLSGIDLDFS